MKIVVLSDSHGNFCKLEQVVLKNKNSDLFIHLGDGINEFLNLKETYKNLPIFMVRGNCDFFHRSILKERIFEICETKILACHGDEYSVKDDLNLLTFTAKQKGAKIALYGHTHIASSEKIDGITLFNPGSLERPRIKSPSYGIVEILENNVSTKIIEI